MEATRGLPTQSTHPFIVLCVAITLLVVPATSGLAGSDNADTAPAADAAGTEAAALPYDGLVPAIEEDFAGQDDVSFSEAIELGKLVGQHQATTLGAELSLEQPVPEHESPSEAAIALAELHDTELAADQRDELQALDTIDEPLRTELTDTIDAFLTFHTAAQQDDPGVLFAARNLLLDATAGLHASLDRTDTTASSTLVLPPLLALDLQGHDSTYTEDVVLSIDAGGDDTYHNNAGGAQATLGLHVPPSIVIPDPGDLPDFVPQPSGRPAGALIDLGHGADAYGNASDPSLLGANGGAFGAGAGFLVDAGGNDTYSAAGSGTNGGARTFQPGDFAAGFLLDAAGNDTYVDGGLGANGGGLSASGTLLDAVGTDTYEAGTRGTNGGSYDHGAGLLVDLSGDDDYVAPGSTGLDEPGVNGGVGGGVVSTPRPLPNLNAPVGQGLLFDAAGTDAYEDDQGGTGTDATVVPKGVVGAQIDNPPEGD